MQIKIIPWAKTHFPQSLMWFLCRWSKVIPFGKIFSHQFTKLKGNFPQQYPNHTSRLFGHNYLCLPCNSLVKQMVQFVSEGAILLQHHLCENIYELLTGLTDSAGWMEQHHTQICWYLRKYSKSLMTNLSTISVSPIHSLTCLTINWGVIESTHLSIKEDFSVKIKIWRQ